MTSNSFIKHFKSLFTDDMGIDLGTMNTLFCQPGHSEDVILNQPSAIAINPHTNKVLAVGDEAKAMIGRCPPNIRVQRPIRNGVITDTMACDRMLNCFISQSRHFKIILLEILMERYRRDVKTIDAQQ